MNYILIENGKVANVAVFGAEPDPEVFPGWIPCPEGVGMGYTDNGDGTFTAPPEPAE